MKVRLNPLAARNDLTDRECVDILGGLIGSLCKQSDTATVQRAVKWWAEHTTGWTALTAYFASQAPPAAKQKK